jgi:hypothetical protein
MNLLLAALINLNIYIKKAKKNECQAPINGLVPSLIFLFNKSGHFIAAFSTIPFAFEVALFFILNCLLLNRDLTFMVMEFYVTINNNGDFRGCE